MDDAALSDTALSDTAKWEVARTCPHLNLKRTVRALTQRFDAALAEHDLHVTQFSLLVTSSLLGRAPLTRLAEELGVDRTTLTRNLKPLERRGWIDTAPSDEDARVRLIGITPLGEALIARAYPLWKRIRDEVIGDLGEEEYATVLERIRRLEVRP